MILRPATLMAVVALALGVFAPLVSATDQVADRNQILVGAPTATNSSRQNSWRAAETVTFWNATGIDTIRATPLGPRGAPLGSRAMAMMHVAGGCNDVHSSQVQAIRNPNQRSP